MKRAAWVILLLLLVTCTTNKLTGRSQYLAYTEEQMVQLGEKAYLEMTVQDKKVTIVTDRRLVEPLLRVGKAIAAAANRPDYKWEFKLIDAPKTRNAWALPGGKIAFYTGIYPMLHDEAGMAIVMGHEVMHAILQHSNERLGTQRLVALGGIAAAVGVGFSGMKSGEKAVVIGALGAGTGLGMLAFSRSHETEADEYGLYLAAKAGYDPRAGIAVWERMGAAGGGAPPEILSTHPGSENRIENMKRWMPLALDHYEKSRKKTNRKLPSIK